MPHRVTEKLKQLNLDQLELEEARRPGGWSDAVDELLVSLGPLVQQAYPHGLVVLFELTDQGGIVHTQFPLSESRKHDLLS